MRPFLGTHLLAALALVPAGQDPSATAVEIEAQLARFGALLATARERPLAEEDLLELVGTGSACGELAPAPGPVTALQSFDLWRAAPAAQDPAHRGRRAVAAELTRLAASFGPADSPLELELALGDLTAARGGWVAELTCSARAGPLEETLRWASRWQPAPRPGEPPQLVWLELRELVAAARRASDQPFVDASAALLGGQSAWRDDLALDLAQATGGLQRELGPGWECDGGLALADVDGDGREDLFVCQPGGLPNRLFLQQQDGSAVESAASLRLDLLDATGAALWLDLDGDGDQDLVSSVQGAVLVHENRDFQGRPRFGLRAALPAFGPGALAAADCDLDGDLDLFASGSAAAFDPERFPEPFDDALGGRPARLFRASLAAERWDFEDVTLEAGLGELRGYLAAASFEDCDGDGDPDLLVADACGPLRAFENRGGRFREATAEWGLEELAHVRSLAWADLDHDGREDLCAAAPALPGGAGGLVWLARDERGRFTRRGRLDAGFVFGCAALDLSNGGWPDLVALGGLAGGAPGAAPLDRFFRGEIAAAPAGAAAYRAAWSTLLDGLRHGASLFAAQPGRAWLNAHGAGFAPAAGPLGLAARGEGRGLASVDWNRDGSLDLIATARSAPRLRVLLNGGAGGERGLALLLVDRGPNRDALGARVELQTNRGPRALSLRAGGSLAQSSKWLHAGLPADGAVLAAAVRWPDGTREAFAGLAPGRWILVRGSGRAAPATPAPAAPATAGAAARPAAPAPGASARALLLAAPIRLPPLPLTAADGAELSLSGAHPRARLVVLSRAAERALRGELLAARAGFERLGLEVLVLTERGATATPGAWPPACAVVRDDDLRVLRLLAGLAFELGAPERDALAVLIDSTGALRAVYGETLAAAAVVAHTRLLDAAPEALRDAAVPFPGRWHAPPPRADLRWLAARLRDAQLDEAARALEVLDYETRELTRESMLTETALVRLRQGAPEEAVRHLREALELAPDWPPALDQLGRALLALGRPAEAGAAFERALLGRPLDALAQAGLARACVELGLFGAARDLAGCLGAQDPARGAALTGEIERRQAESDARGVIR